YGRLFFGLLKRSILLFVLEVTVYFAGLALMIAFILRLTPETVSAVILMRTFTRYHFIVCILFASVNAVIYEYFCASLFFDKNVGREGLSFTEEESSYAKEGLCGKARLKKRLLSLALVTVLCVAAAEMIFFFRNGNVFLAETLDELCITAHRGASGGAPENTAAAIELAIEEAADYAELDVRLTADGVPVLLHDAALFRTTRVPKNIWEVTYAEVSEYDAGSSYSAEFAGEKIPCLEEVFERYGGEIGFNIELKTSDDRALAEAVVELVERYHLERSCVITSTSYQQLVWVKELNEGLKTGYILSFVYGDFYKSEAADFFSIRSGFISESVVEKAHSVGKEVHAWTVNRENELKRMKAVGVDNIITDKPAYAREIIYGGRLAETIEEWIRILTLKK
ncbi:MAG: glycerophosphodiester phosphodiesterase, partial [Lachnospiraceae bacterium]